MRGIRIPMPVIVRYPDNGTRFDMVFKGYQDITQFVRRRYIWVI